MRKNKIDYITESGCSLIWKWTLRCLSFISTPIRRTFWWSSGPAWSQLIRSETDTDLSWASQIGFPKNLELRVLLQEGRQSRGSEMRGIQICLKWSVFTTFRQRRMKQMYGGKGQRVSQGLAFCLCFSSFRSLGCFPWETSVCPSNEVNVFTFFSLSRILLLRDQVRQSYCLELK